MAADDAQANQIAFGHSEISKGMFLSRLGFGAAPVGGLFTDVAEEDALVTLRHAMSRGVNYFDSALLYGCGKSLERVGIALGIAPSKELAISFKVGRLLVDGPDDPNAKDKPVQNVRGYHGCDEKQFVFDYSPSGIERAFAQSMDYLNKGRMRNWMPALKPADLNIIVYVHDPGVAEHGERNQAAIMRSLLDEGFPTLRRMQDSGLIKAYGIGTNEIKPCIQAAEDPGIKVMLLAGRGTLLCNGAPASKGTIRSDGQQLAELVRKLRRHANSPKVVIAAIGNSGLGYGGSFYNYAAADHDALKLRDDVAAGIADYGERSGESWSMSDLLVHYPFDHFGEVVAAVMPGPRSIAEFEGVAGSFERKVPADLWSALQTRGLISGDIA